MTHLPASQRAASLPGAPFASARRSKSITQAVRTTLFCNRTHPDASLHKKWALKSREIDRPRQPGNLRGMRAMRVDRPRRLALLKLYGRCTACACGRTSITRTSWAAPPIRQRGVPHHRQATDHPCRPRPCPLPTPRKWRSCGLLATPDDPATPRRSHRKYAACGSMAHFMELRRLTA